MTPPSIESSRRPASRSIAPPATIGMLGGGQLGRYALMAARTMGYRTVVLDPDPAAPAGAIADRHLRAEFDDTAALDQLADLADVVTAEFENPPASALERLASRTFVAPAPAAMAVAQDRVAEKTFLADVGIPVGPWMSIAPDGAQPSGGEVWAEPVWAGGPIAYPAIVKTARLGYDGKGQRVVADATEATAAWKSLGAVPCVVEQRLDLQAEVSAIVARRADGAVAAYPVQENVHVGGILDLTVVPARVDATLADRAVGLASAIADALDFVGVLAVEFFVVDDELLVNELAPRPHNSGHWTLNVAQTNQFEQQIRAVCGLGLGDTSMSAPGAAMVNLLGDEWDDGEPDWAAMLAIGNTALHLYGKTTPRPQRKMGHLTTWAASPDRAETLAVQARRALRREQSRQSP